MNMLNVRLKQVFDNHPARRTLGEKSEETRNRIVLGAIECIERQGIVNTTVRTIAAEAGVNVAAISYHFGSKDALIEVALNHALGNFFGDLSGLLEREFSSCAEGLGSFYSYLLDGVTRYPGITRAHLSGPFLEGRYNRPFVTGFVQFLVQFAAKMTRQPDAVNTGLNRAIEQAVSAILLLGMLPGLFDGFTDRDMTDSRVRAEYIETLVAAATRTEVKHGRN